jgi:putative transposase
MRQLVIPGLPCFSAIGCNRRRACDFKATIASATAFLYAASVSLLARRIARCE